MVVVASWLPPVAAGQVAGAAAETGTADANAEAWRSPDPPAASERRGDRHEMVAEQIATPGDLREPVTDLRVLEAMRTVPRHVFMPDNVRAMAYRDTPLPIGHGQTISQPYIVALMAELLEVEQGDRVLEIGTGSGYQAAVLGQLTPNVYSIEIIEPLAERARRVLDEQGYDHVETRQGDGYFGWREHAPFDGVIVTAAAGHVPPPLWEQLAPGGRLVIPIGGTYQVQRLVVLTKTMDGGRRSETVLSVRFVPMTGRAQE
jgi:protein-L-isoaspartate(D-aspartate) O-methyltransferase